MKLWRRILKLMRLWLRHGLFFAYWLFYDVALTISTKLRRENHIGIYVKIISPSEVALIFNENSVGWGYVGYTLIKIGFKAGWCTEDAVTDILEHETLHQVLGARIGGKAKDELDNIHIALSFVSEDGRRKFWRIDFINK